jgi:hypothetical protein
MSRFSRRTLTLCPLLLMGALILHARAADIVTLDVPPVSAAGTARGFEFTSFQFRVYVLGIGDAETDHSANTMAASNDQLFL